MPALAWLLCAALLLAQWAGLAHRVAHGATHAAETAHGGADAAWQDAFEGHDEGGAECRLYDQLSHADTLAAALLPFVEPGLRQLPAAGGSVGRGAPCCAAYLARAPPRG